MHFLFLLVVLFGYIISMNAAALDADENTIFKITIKSIGRPDFSTNVRPDTTVGQLRNWAESIVGLPARTLKLMDGKKMFPEDSRTLISYGIKEDTTIYLVVIPSSPSVVEVAEKPLEFVMVKTLKGQNKKFGVTPEMTIRELKALFTDHFKVNADTFRAIQLGNELKDDQTLSDYNVKNDSIVFLLPALVPPVTVPPVETSSNTTPLQPPSNVNYSMSTKLIISYGLLFIVAVFLLCINFGSTLLPNLKVKRKTSMRRTPRSKAHTTRRKTTSILASSKRKKT